MAILTSLILLLHKLMFPRYPKCIYTEQEIPYGWLKYNYDLW